MIRIGIICPSEIALRRFMPALKKVEKGIVFVGIGYASPKEWFGNLNNISRINIIEQQERERSKAQAFIDAYGGRIYESYQELIESTEVDAIYLPLPPALHYYWAKLALENGKHVFIEKPSTTCIEHTDNLISIAAHKGLALHENYMFLYHNQIKELDKIVHSGEIGDVRLIRLNFGFPKRQANDFRYNKELGGGALLDAGGYCLKYANYLLGGNSKVAVAHLNNISGFDVDIFGSATLVNQEDQVVQLAFGMDNDYKCDVEFWGSKGTIIANRIFTAPTDFIPTYTIKKNQEIETHPLPADDAFMKSICHFIRCVQNAKEREENYKILHEQESLLEEFRRKLANSKSEQ